MTLAITHGQGIALKPGLPGQGQSGGRVEAPAQEHNRRQLPGHDSSPVLRYGSCTHEPYRDSPATSVTVETPPGTRLSIVKPIVINQERGSGSAAGKPSS